MEVASHLTTTRRLVCSLSTNPDESRSMTFVARGCAGVCMDTTVWELC